MMNKKQITHIKPQQKDGSRVSIFLDKKYALSLSLEQLKSEGLKVGDEVPDSDVQRLKSMSEFGKLYNRAIQQLARRPRSEWEIRDYLKRKAATPGEIDTIVGRLKNYNYLDDHEFASAWVRSRRALKPTSKVKLQQELAQKRVPKDIVHQVLAEDETTDRDTLRQLVETKRKQTRYRDDQKLIAYLARQGFKYGDIKQTLEELAS